MIFTDFPEIYEGYFRAYVICPYCGLGEMRLNYVTYSVFHIFFGWECDTCNHFEPMSTFKLGDFAYD